MKFIAWLKNRDYEEKGVQRLMKIHDDLWTIIAAACIGAIMLIFAIADICMLINLIIKI